MNKIDLKILQLLANNARITNVELAEAVCLSPAATYRRVKNLEEKGIIKGYITLVNAEIQRCATQVIIRITLSSQESAKLAEFEQQVATISNVLGCYLISGDYDYLLHVGVADIKDYEQLHKHKLSSLPHVSRLQSNFALKEVVRRINPQLD